MKKRKRYFYATDDESSSGGSDTDPISDDFDDKVKKRSAKVVDTKRLKRLENAEGEREKKIWDKKDKKLDTPRGHFDEKTALAAFPAEQDLLWSQLQKLPDKKMRGVAERLLVYLMIYQRDVVRFSKNGEIMISNHPIPGSNLATSLRSLLTPHSNSLAIGELTLLQALQHSPKGLWDLVPANKKKWLMGVSTHKVEPNDVISITPVAPAKPKTINLTNNIRDGQLLQKDMNPRFTKIQRNEGLARAINTEKKKKGTPSPWWTVLEPN